MFPVLIENSWFTLYSYPLFMGLAWGIGHYFSKFLFESRQVFSNNFYYIFWGSFFFSWVGAKVLFLLVSAGENKIELLVDQNFWLGGGFVFYGGFLAIVIYLIVGCFFKFISLGNLYLFLPGIAFGHGVGRIGCFLAGCCYGEKTQFPVSIHLHNASRHPVQLYESFSLILLGGVLWLFIQKKLEKKWIISLYLFAYSLIRFCLEFIRGDKIRGISFFSTSQFVSLAIIFIGLPIFLYLTREKEKKTP